MSTIEQRFDHLERQMQALTQRVYRLDGGVATAPAAPAAAAQSAAPDVPIFGPSRPSVLPPPPERTAPRRPTISVTPSRVLAAAGGLVLLLGIGFLLRYAVVRGWLGPEVRVLLALVASVVLGRAGVRLERTDATRIVGQICTATAAAGAYAAVVAAAVLYALVPPAVGLVAAAAVAGVAIARGAWTRTQSVSALGVGGALLSPVFVDAAGGGLTLALLVVALGAGLIVALRRQWPAITLLAFVITVPQVWEIGVERAPLPIALGLTGLVGAMFLAATVAAARGRDANAAFPSIALAGLNSVVVASLGYAILSERLAEPANQPALWLAAVALVHLASGFALCRRYFAPPIGVVLTVAGAVIADVAIFDLTTDYTTAVVLGAVALAAGAAMTVSWLRAPARIVAVLHVVLFACYSAFIVIPEPGVGSAEAVLLVASLCAAAVAFVALVTRTDSIVAIAGGAVFGGLAVLRLLAHEAPLSALLEGPRDLGGAVLMCGVLVATALLLGQIAHRRFVVVAVAIANYAVSLAAVALDPDGIGRVALTGLWATAGGLALVAGRRRELPDLRRGGAALLAAAVTKAALLDTTTLSGSNRAAALLLCGSVLVAAAVAEARAAGETHDAVAPTP